MLRPFPSPRVEICLLLCNWCMIGMMVANMIKAQQATVVACGCVRLDIGVQSNNVALPGPEFQSFLTTLGAVLTSK